jgi:hypothetical protein
MQQRLPKYRRDPERLEPRRITDRSLNIIAIIERYKFLPSSLIAQLAGGHPKRTMRHLQTLYHNGFINRFTFPRVGNPGEFIYYLDDVRALELLVTAGADREALDFEGIKRNREKTYADINLGGRIDDMQGRLMHLLHEVMISRFHAMIERACRQSNDEVELAEWRQGPSLWNRVEVAKLQQDANGNWREKDETEILPHRPDAFFALRFKNAPQGQQIANFFYEADRKHTSIKKHNRKLRAHFHYIVKQRRHEADYGIKRVRAVLIETTDMYWADDLRAAARHPTVSGNKPSPLFWFTTSEIFTRPQEVEEGRRRRTVPLHLLKPNVIFRKVWASPVDDTLYSLLD